MDGFFCEAVSYFKSGGVLMLPLFALAVYLYYASFMLFFKLLKFHAECRDPRSTKRNLSRFFNVASLDGAMEDKELIKRRFDEVRREILPPAERSLSMIKILAGTAPLLGLLGTVSGMAFALSEIGADSNGVAEGVSRALITTQCGLSIALPALILAMFCSMLRQKILVNLSRCESCLILGEDEK